MGIYKGLLFQKNKLQIPNKFTLKKSYIYPKMPEHTSPAAALEPFVLLANGAKGAAAISLISQVLEAPSVYVFGELLDHANIADLENSHAEGPSHLRLLEIFAYGTYSDYISDQQISSLPNLTDGMLKKTSTFEHCQPSYTKQIDKI